MRATATLALTACQPNPNYAPVDHVTIAELEAGSVATAPGTALWVQRSTECDCVNRCVANLGGTYHAVIGGEAHVCVVAG